MTNDQSSSLDSSAWPRRVLESNFMARLFGATSDRAADISITDDSDLHETPFSPGKASTTPQAALLNWLRARLRYETCTM